jgi:hypothetical protein
MSVTTWEEVMVDYRPEDHIAPARYVAGGWLLAAVIFIALVVISLSVS